MRIGERRWRCVSRTSHKVSFCKVTTAHVQWEISNKYFFIFTNRTSCIYISSTFSLCFKTAENMSANFEFLDRPTDDIPKIKVICIGGGISGILTAIKIPQRCQNFELAIYEKNADLGGTWSVPALQCRRI